MARLEAPPLLYWLGFIVLCFVSINKFCWSAASSRWLVMSAPFGSGSSSAEVQPSDLQPRQRWSPEDGGLSGPSKLPSLRWGSLKAPGDAWEAVSATFKASS